MTKKKLPSAPKRPRGRPKKGQGVGDPPPPVAFTRPRGRPRKDAPMVLSIEHVARELYVTGQRHADLQLPEDFPVEPSIADVAGATGLGLAKLQNTSQREHWMDQRTAYWKTWWEKKREADGTFLVDRAVSTRRDIFAVAQKFVALSEKIADANKEAPNPKEVALGVKVLLDAAKACDMAVSDPNADEKDAPVSIGIEDWMAMRWARTNGPVLELGMDKREKSNG